MHLEGVKPLSVRGGERGLMFIRKKTHVNDVALHIRHVE